MTKLEYTKCEKLMNEAIQYAIDARDQACCSCKAS